jgi:hypothetical protein
MTQSKDNNYTINLDDLDINLNDITMNDTITINLDDTYGTTTTYWAGSNVTDYTISTDSTITFDDGISITGDFGHIDLDSWRAIHPDDVEKMCKEYPALEKVWRNFKSVYDMVKQDYEGKKKAGEIDDDIPF